MLDNVIELREPGAPPRRITVTTPLTVGREGSDVLVADEQVSRRHLRLEVRDSQLVVEDLGTTNGTAVDGVRISAPTIVPIGGVIRLGRVEIEVLSTASPTATGLVPGDGTPASESVDVAVAPRPGVDELESRDAGAAVVRFAPGTAGARAGSAMESSVRRARKRLSGFGSEPWGVRPQLLLVNPFPDPDRPGDVVASGTVIDVERSEIWMVVTPESPPEPPERPLAVLFGAALPAAAELQVLIEGYGLVLADAPDRDAELRELELPPLAHAEGELRSAMAASFVAYLIERDGREAFVDFLHRARPGHVDATAQEVFGAGLTALEESWRMRLVTGEVTVPPGQFLRLTLRYIRPHMRRQVEIFLYMLFGLAFTMVFPFIFRRLLDSAIPSGEFGQVVSLLTVLGVIFAVSLLADLRRAYVSAYVSASIVRTVRIEMFDRLQRLSPRWFGRNNQGDVMARLFSDVGQMEAGVSDALREGVFQVLSLAVSSVVLLTLDPLLAVIVLAAAPLIALIYKLMAKEAQRRSMAVQEELGSVYTVANENYSAQEVVKAFALEGRERRRFEQVSERLFTRQLRLQLFGGFFGLSVEVVVTALRLFVLGLGAWLILDGRLTIGTLVAFMSVMGEVLNPVTTLTGLGQQIQASTGSLVRINEVLAAAPDITNEPDDPPLPPLEREIRLAGVGFSYTPGERTLDGIDCVIRAGQRVAFVGPTGAGKSSVLQLLQRMYDVDEGAILVDGHDIRRVQLASLRAQIGVVFQDTFLFDTTIRENIAMAKPGASDAEIEQAARAAELHEAVAAMPRGYDTPVGERGSRLSGGQRQRVAIARALLRDPRILVLDEATSALDPRTERMISDTLERVGQGRTTVAVTHRLTSITDYDAIFVIVAGRLVEQGTHDELLQAGGVYADLWAEQMGGEPVPEPPFDVVAALSRIPVLSELSADELSQVPARLKAFALAPGDTLPEGGGISILRSGAARVVAPGLSGQPVEIAELRPGDAFGVGAVLGHHGDTMLEATERTGILMLDADVLAALADLHPSVAAALTGSRPAPAPAGGVRLSRMTLGPAARVAAPPEAEPPTAGEVRRLTGSFRAVQR